MRNLAMAASSSFADISYLQLGLICLLAPVFMAGAIAQEANPKTWDILLTTPLNALQIVLGNLFGRLFFILALLFSSLPLFLVTQYFGGVPGRSIFLSYVIAGVSALVVGSIAIALSVSRKAGKRAVFVFYVTVIIYLFMTYALDQSTRITMPGGVSTTTWFTPLNPFLALEGLLQHQTYRPLSPDAMIGRGFVYQLWRGAPVATFCGLGTLFSVFLMVWSTIFLRLIGQKVGDVPWYARLFRGKNIQRAEDGSIRRPSREVWKNPIAWREASSKQGTVAKIIARWGFVIIGIAIAVGMICWFHFTTLSVTAMRQMLQTVLGTEIAIISLTALNISATAISREREDGTLDLLLTTPLTPSYYITGKLRGVVAFLLPMLAVPIATAALCAIYIMFDGLGRTGGVTYVATFSSGREALPFILPESVIVFGLLLVPFASFCVMVGLHWSLKTKGTIGSIISSVGIVVVVVGILSLCGVQAGQGAGVIGAVICGLVPTTAVWAVVFPDNAFEIGSGSSLDGARVGLMVGSAIAAVTYTFIVYGIHKAMLGPNGKNFDMTVRKLAGTS